MNRKIWLLFYSSLVVSFLLPPILFVIGFLDHSFWLFSILILWLVFWVGHSKYRLNSPIALRHVFTSFIIAILLEFFGLLGIGFWAVSGITSSTDPKAIKKHIEELEDRNSFNEVNIKEGAIEIHFKNRIVKEIKFKDVINVMIYKFRDRNRIEIIFTETKRSFKTNRYIYSNPEIYSNSKIQQKTINEINKAIEVARKH